MSDSEKVVYVIVLLFIMLFVGMFMGMSVRENLPSGVNMVAFQDGEIHYPDQVIRLDQPLSIESLEGSILVSETQHTYIHYDLTFEEAKILGQGFAQFLANNYVADEYETSNGLGLRTGGWKQPLPKGVDPYHFSIAQKG